MKKFFLITFLLSFYFGFAQDKRTYFHSELDMVLPYDQKVIYSHSRGNYNLDERIMVGASFTYNYNLFNRFSAGALAGFSYLPNPSIPTLKFGGSLRYTFIPEYQANVYLQLAGYVPLTSGVSMFDFGELRAGAMFPIARFEKYTLTLGFYTIVSYFELSKPLFAGTELAGIDYRGKGVSLGFRF